MSQAKYWVLISVSGFVIALDQLTKRCIVGHFRLAESHALIPEFFSLTYVRNTGAAFGILHDSSESFRIPFFVIVPLLALFAIGYVFRRIPAYDFRVSSALSLVVGGALGNLIDRLQWGYVVDFLDFHWNYRYHFPAFNVADSAICMGVAALMLDLVLRPNESVPGDEEIPHAPPVV